ncbi:MAG: DUF4392 domain-containing protein [Clostridiales Family XIII bacterium]|jgi:hypothetical protein|nr:DUF4392 domain-containing protein [Clostridiales Family XIII bacterium]
MALEYDIELAETVGEIVDRLITVQIAGAGGGAAKTAKPICPQLYDAARAAQGDKALTFLAAKAIMENVQPRDTVALSAGLMIAPSMREEVDGVLGIVGLARAVALGCGATPVILTEDTNLPRVEWVVKAAGLNPQPIDIALQLPYAVGMVVLPRDPEKTVQAMKDLYAKARPKVLVVSEKMGPSDIGIYRTGPGFDLSKIAGKTQEMVNTLKELGTITIGIGDGGNEVGMGLIKEDIRRIFSGDSAAATVTDILITAATGNLGAYGIEAVLAAAYGLEEVLHGVEIEKQMELGSIFGGLIDPQAGIANGWTDTMEPCVAEAIILLLQHLVRNRLAKKDTEKAARKKAREFTKEQTQAVIDEWEKKLS